MAVKQTDIGASAEAAAKAAALDRTFLDWPELLARLGERAQSSRGAEAARTQALADDADEARARMAEVSELAAILRAGENAPSLSFPEIEGHLDAVEKGVPLGAEELKQVASLCEAAEGVQRYFARFAPDRAGNGPTAVLLGDLAAQLSRHDELVYRARETFDAAGEIRDSASPELFRLRRERDSLAARTRQEVESLLSTDEFEPYLQDRYVTLRGDRFVLPLRASFKSMGLGIVHDTSRSGETVFVEPTRVVELNNRLKVAEIEIRRESRRILEEIAALVAEAAPLLRGDRDLLTRLDVICAKARLSVEYDGVPVDIADEPVVDLRQVRHPLLALRAVAERFAVTPNDLSLGHVPGHSEARVLIVSGPNAGGKTVLLKAVGVAALLVRAGMHVPAAPGSRVGFFHDVLADIGDQQSVLGDLSTFSAHLANIGMILDRVSAGRDERVLVLLDELMAGTHPEQGAALARATLESLADSSALVITTTHFDSLKALTDSDARFRNAGMEYDLAALRPTFRLRDGLPGRSYALDIAARMGLPPFVLERARALVGATTLGLEDVLRNLEEREQALADSVAALERARTDLEARAGDQKEAAASLARRERDLAVRSRDVIDGAVRQARNAIEEIVREVRKTRTRAAAEQARVQLEETAKRAALGLPERPALDVDKLRDALASRALGLPATSSKHKPAPTQKAPVPTRPDEIPLAIQTRSNTVDVRGMRADEALRAVGDYLDRAVLDGNETVFVIHGHGTGALRKVVREFLATSAYVQRFRAGGPGEGGDGVTVLSLRG